MRNIESAVHCAFECAKQSRSGRGSGQTHIEQALEGAVDLLARLPRHVLDVGTEHVAVQLLLSRIITVQFQFTQQTPLQKQTQNSKHAHSDCSFKIHSKISQCIVFRANSGNLSDCTVEVMATLDFMHFPRTSPVIKA